MTLENTYNLECKCGQVFKAELYETINVTLDPTLLEKLFKGEINLVECPKCHTKAHIRKPLLFHDMKHDLMIMVENGNLNSLINDLESRGLYPEFKDDTKIQKKQEKK